MREVEEPELPDPMDFLGSDEGLRWLCRQLTDQPLDQLALYYDTDMVDVMRLVAEQKASRIVQRLAENWETVRTAT